MFLFTIFFLFDSLDYEFLPSSAESYDPPYRLVLKYFSFYPVIKAEQGQPSPFQLRPNTLNISVT